ncbi:MAG: pseudouridylate synthase [Bacteroidales bacterium]|nr:pseudouridylate synthase [Bacteroidales bacterium]
MKEEEIDILTLIPQRPPFVMVDRLLHFDTQTTITEFEVRADNIFVDDGKLSSEGLVENIAQTCAARMGYISLMSHTPVKVGVIGAISNMTINFLPQCGARLTTRIDLLEEVFQMTLVNAQVTVGEDVVASANMKIALTDIEAAN